MKVFSKCVKKFICCCLLFGAVSAQNDDFFNNINVDVSIEAFRELLKDDEIAGWLNDIELESYFLNAYLHAFPPEGGWEGTDDVEELKNIAQNTPLCTSAVWDEQGNAYIQGGGLPSFDDTKSVASVLDASLSPTRSATILIVDDFDGRDTKFAVNLTGGVSHGNLVFYHTVKVLQAFGFREKDFSSSGSVFEKDDFTITLQAVNLDPRNIRDIPNIIQNALPTHHDEQVIINMSWSIVPCEWKDKVEEYAKQHAEQSVYQNYDAKIYLKLIANENDELCAEEFFPSFSALKGLISDIIPQNEVNEETVDLVCKSIILLHGLHSFVAKSNLDSQFHLREIIRENTYVAAAGNFSAPFPFVPAYWSFVHSIAASDNNNPRAEYSNDGCKIEHGGPFSTSANSTSGYQGTSFAAPIASVLYAIGENPTTHYPGCQYDQ